MFVARIPSCIVFMVLGALVLAWSPLASAQSSSCPHGSIDCERRAVILVGAGCGDMVGYRYDTGWLPDGTEEIQFRVQVQLGGLIDDELNAAGVTMDGDGVASWPPPMAVGFEAEADDGTLRVAYGIDLTVEVRVEFEVGGIDVRDTREIPIPYVSDIVDNLQMEGETRFTPVAFGEEITARGTSDRFTVFEYDVLGSILDPIEVLGLDIDFGGGFRLDLEGYAEARYTTTAIDVDGAILPMTAADPLAIIPPPVVGGYGSSQTLVLLPSGEFDCDIGISLIPTLFIEIHDWSLEWDFPIDFDVEGTSTPALFEPVEEVIPLADFSVNPEVIDLGTVPAGSPAEDIITLSNNGEALLFVALDTMSSAITLSESYVSIDPGGDVIVTVGADLAALSPDEAGVLLTTNDPDSHRVVVGLLGEALEPPDEPDGGPDDPDGGPDGGPDDPDGGPGDPDGDAIDDSGSISGGCRCSVRGEAGGRGFAAALRALVAGL